MPNRFGDRIAVGDITGDGRVDLAVGAPGQDVSNRQNAGSITVLPGTGTGTGVDRNRAQMATRAYPGVAGTALQGRRLALKP